MRKMSGSVGSDLRMPQPCSSLVMVDEEQVYYHEEWVFARNKVSFHKSEERRHRRLKQEAMQYMKSLEHKLESRGIAVRGRAKNDED